MPREFQAHNGWFLITDEGVFRCSDGRDHRAKFHVEEHGDGKISLRSHNGRFVSVDSGKNIFFADNYEGKESKFTQEWYDGKVALKAHHGGFLRENNGAVHVHYEPDYKALFTEYRT